MACDEKADERAESRAALVDTSRQKPARYDCRPRPAKDVFFFSAGRKKKPKKAARCPSLFTIATSHNQERKGKQIKQKLEEVFARVLSINQFNAFARRRLQFSFFLFFFPCRSSTLPLLPRILPRRRPLNFFLTLHSP